nr:retrovirus-related Pol polyprotein from transposon TNT 1-94 [Tanacetum cinerariifolium]
MSSVYKYQDPTSRSQCSICNRLNGSNGLESLLNQDSLIISSLKIASLLDEFAGELALLKSIPSGIDETDCDPEEETRLIKKLLYDNSSPLPLEEFISKNYDTMPSGIKEDDYDSKRDILILEELLSNDSLLFPKNESFHFDIPSSSRPPAKPPDESMNSSDPNVSKRPTTVEVPKELLKVSMASKTKSWLWNRRLSHLNFVTINHLARHDLVRGLPKLKFKKDQLCSACPMGKSKKKPYKRKSKDTNQEKLYLLHMDLCGPMHVASVNGKKYILVIVDDYSQFTWVKCLRSKDEALYFIIKFLKMIKVPLKTSVRRIRTDNETEFVNQTLREYYQKVGISHETSVARYP